MSSAESLRVLGALSRHRATRRERAAQAKRNVDALIRRPAKAEAQQDHSSKAEEEEPKEEEDPRAREQQRRRERNAATLRAADRLATQRSKNLHRDIIELLRAQKERRRPRLKKKKQRLTFFDFEDAE
ncbi:hypothetical protein H4R18_003478 [Coemansia javaensis]|uniref:Uncharacterized protein n=1 Tax=Coemansia javaensis TaxID=2761396 RepID=A0A9W8H8Z7_9FUNG|nr:hypothetical protein H4R18_003478 [Coemansia javaensis]